MASTIQITDDASYLVQTLEIKQEKAVEWRSVRTISAARKGMREGAIMIHGKESFAIYDHCFYSDERTPVFETAGKYQFRIRLKCLLGEFVTESVGILVKDRPASEKAAIRNDAAIVSDLLSGLTTPRFSDAYKKLRKNLAAGSIKRSLDLMAKYEDFRRTGSLEGKDVTVVAAFHELSKDCDEVRKEQLAARFVRDAFQQSQWGDLEVILETFKEDSGFRRAYQGQLRHAKGEVVGDTPGK